MRFQERVDSAKSFEIKSAVPIFRKQLIRKIMNIGAINAVNIKQEI